MATDLAQVFGNDAAREILGHHPNSKVLEEYYLEFACMKNLVAVGVDEPLHGQDMMAKAETNKQSVNRLTPVQVAKTQGAALNAMLNHVLATDSKYQALTDVHDRRHYKINMRGRVFDALYKKANEKAWAEMTIETARERRAELFSEASEFSKYMLRVLKDPTLLQSELIGIGDRPSGHISLDEDFSEDGRAEQHEPDADELLSSHQINDNNEIIPQIDEDLDADEEGAYDEVGQIFIKILLTKGTDSSSRDEPDSSDIRGSQPAKRASNFGHQPAPKRSSSSTTTTTPGQRFSHSHLRQMLAVAAVNVKRPANTRMFIGGLPESTLNPEDVPAGYHLIDRPSYAPIRPEDVPSGYRLVDNPY